MRFSDIHGLEATKKQLVAIAQRNRVAHAQLFSGIEGSALLPMALAYATYLNCTNPSATDACGVCDSCSKCLKYIHPDVHFIFPVSGTEDVKVKDALSKVFLPSWRKFLLDNPYGNLNDWAMVFGGENKQLTIYTKESREIIDALSLTAFEGKYKIMLIWTPELMHPNAANSILKILEEPSGNTVFLLVSPDKERLLGTIRSRTQLILIPPFTDDELLHILVNQNEVEREKAKHLVQLSGGSLRTALNLGEDTDLNLHTMFIDWMRNCFSNRFGEAAADAEKFYALTKSAQKTLLLYGLEILRESLVAGYDDNKLLRVNGVEKEFVVNFSKTLSTDIIKQVSDKLSEAHYHLERNANAKMIFMNLSILISRLFKIRK